jgi:hypothetical protein
MATRKPLVLVSGEIQQLQSGDTLGISSETGQATLTNSDAAGAVVGEIFYVFGSDSLKKAKADAGATCTGNLWMATAIIAAAATGVFQENGVVTGLSGLTPGAVYYLSAATAGAMTVTPPSTTGQYVVRLGTALSATEFQFAPERAILL